MVDPPIHLSEPSIRLASLNACLDFSRSPWRSPIATRRSGGVGYRVRKGACEGGDSSEESPQSGGQGSSGKKRPPLTEKSTKASTKEERNLGTSSHKVEEAFEAVSIISLPVSPRLQEFGVWRLENLGTRFPGIHRKKETHFSINGVYAYYYYVIYIYIYN